MAKGPVDRVVSMLDDDAPERRMAAVIVLGELAAKPAQKKLLAMLEADAPAIQRHVLEALRRIGLGKRSVGALWPTLASRDEGVRRAGAAALASIGESVVPEVRARLAEAEGDERRALESVLSQLGGSAAFDALLDALVEGDEESNRATALEMRGQVKEADTKTRRGYRAQLVKLLKKKGLSASAQAAAVKVLGFLEDPTSAKTLLQIARSDRPATVRQEAWIALRFTLSGGASAEVLESLVAAAGDADRALAQTALMTLAALEVPERLAPKLSALALHPDFDRARMAIDKIGSLSGKKVSETLVGIVADGDKRRAELAAEALEGRKDAVAPLAKALANTDELERAKLIARAVSGAKLAPAAKKALLDAGAAQLAAGVDAWEPKLRLLDEKAVAKRLGDDAKKLKKRKKGDAEARVLRAMLRLGLGEDAHRYRVASLGLADSALEPRGRRSDPALRWLAELANRGFDVVGALSKDRSVSLEALYYVGFCFLEDDHAGGEELLELVVQKGGRKKIAKAAKNKLKLGA